MSPQLQIALWSGHELETLVPMFAEAFEVGSFHRQLIHRWECFTACTNSGVYIDITRTRNDESGDFERPVLVTLGHDRSALPNDEIRSWAKVIADRLDTDVSVGKLTRAEDRPYDYGFNIEETYRKLR